MRSSIALLAGAAAALLAAPVSAATLPKHDPLNITVVADEVNPHGLSDEQLTQPEDLVAAIGSEDSGLTIGTLVAVDSSCVDDALAAMPETDVLVYFAHRAARACDGADAQAQLTSATESLLEAGGGVVVLHHGLYTAGGKGPILELLGGVADDIEWLEQGRPVIAVAPEHFVVTHEVEYPDESPLESAELGIAAANYPSYLDAPAESYPGTRLLLQGDEQFELLFASQGDGVEVLGYDLRRPNWAGHTLFFQPGEYQPNAFDDPDSNNFQIFANAIFYAGTTQDTPDPSGTTGEETGADPGDDGSSGGPIDDSTSGGPGTSDPGGGGVDAGGDSGSVSGEASAPADASTGGGCRVGDDAPVLALLLPVLLGRLSRRRGRPH